MSRVPAYHSNSLEPDEPKVYHIFDNCPSGEQIEQRHLVLGKGGYRRCKKCSRKRDDGKF
ncbi:MAG: hypothetical protein ACHQ01_07660 [Candidatus Limnocylindrales bacterium]